MGHLHRSPFPSGLHDRSPAGWPCDGRLTVPALTIQFHAPVHFQAIRGLYGFTNQLEAPPAICWGRNGRCFAFLHRPDARSPGARDGGLPGRDARPPAAMEEMTPCPFA